MDTNEKADTTLTANQDMIVESKPEREASALPVGYHVDEAAEKRLLRKLDFTIYPVLYIVYMLSFLDRINIGNAKIQGMTADLDLSGSRYNIALFIYYISYILLEVPSNMVFRHVRPPLYLGGLMFCWGVVNMCMGFVTSFQALVGLRFLLGIFEAGVLPGIIYLTSMYYKRHEFQKRMSFFFSSTLLSGAVGGLLAYAIVHIGSQQGRDAWRWIFIIEGAVTAFISILACFLIVDWPDRNRYLTADEKELLERRLAADGGDICRMDRLDSYALKLIWTDYKIWLGALIYLGLGTTGLALSFFLPSILSEFGWVAVEAQARTIPVYVVAGAGMLGCAWLSDRLKQRYLFIMIGTAVATIGYVMLLCQSSLGREAKYAAVFLICLGAYIGIPISLAWLANNLSGHWKRAFGTGVQITIGNVAGIVATNIFLMDESPSYPTGYGTSFAMLWMGAIASTVMWALMRRENRKRDAGERDSRLTRPDEQVRNMGDYHPSFRFTL